jgi:hypothetical protein
LKIPFIALNDTKHFEATRPALMLTKKSQNKTQRHDSSGRSAAPPAFTDE